MNKTTSTLITILLTAIIVGGGVYFFQKNEIDTLREEITTIQEQEGIEEILQDDEPANSATSTDLKTYTSEELGLSFQYPSKWDEITEGTDHGHFILKAGDDTFFTADNYPYEGPDRGFGWTDLSAYIEDQDFINNFCDSPIFPNNVQECEILENSNGIKYVKTLEELHTEGGLLGIAHNYYFFNPNSEDFSGIVISSIWLDDNGLFNLEEALDKLVESINFI